MKGIVIYSTKRSVTKQIAQAIFDELLIDKEIKTVDEAPADLREYDIVFAGFWMEKGKPTADGEWFLKKLADANVALFGAMAEPPATSLARESLRRNRELLHKSNLFLGGFICQAKKDAREIERPDKGDIWGAKIFAREMYFSLRS
ncbi:flavodoxin family protein [Megasphaera cerevisiae]|jgi:flavodoxin|uniref:flavodoxin family protein n=1 Tax=Megasphaera cerevisiae TaxID=39029 RepID=UPI00065AEC06|nr:flavodoxin family protein [Megasphaera cerevisiae]MCI1749922.1 flavodoxin family protein [Megasphaera cerevisiae]OKY54839.1 hypothetical protein BSR42_00610 [Megasphaera cerevisiae]SJZ39227.1 Flavodoxin domain-containing protein [Megasphaera cerevisiae DSM 20462]